MKEISVAFAVSHANAKKYLPMTKNLDENICCCYEIGFPRGYTIVDEPFDKMKLTKFPTRLSRIFTGLIVKMFSLPNHYVYWAKIKLFDLWVARKISIISAIIIRYSKPNIIHKIGGIHYDNA